MGAPAVAAMPRAAEAPEAAPATAPKPATRSTAASVEREDPHAAPTIAGIELKPAAGGKQWFGVIGAGFRPGARLELRDMLNGTVFTAQAPAKLSGSRIDYEARVGNAQSNWLVTVRNADGTKSEAYGFTAGPGVASSVAGAAKAAEAQAQRRAAAALAAEKAAADTAVTAQTQAEKDAAEQAAGLQREQERLAAEKAQMNNEAASKAALDREFEAKMAADRAAFEKREAVKKKKKR